MTGVTDKLKKGSVEARYWKEILYSEGGEILEEVPQRGCGSLILALLKARLHRTLSKLV